MICYVVMLVNILNESVTLRKSSFIYSQGHRLADSLVGGRKPCKPWCSVTLNW